MCRKMIQIRLGWVCDRVMGLGPGPGLVARPWPLIVGLTYSVLSIVAKAMREAVPNEKVLVMEG